MHKLIWITFVLFLALAACTSQSTTGTPSSQDTVPPTAVSIEASPTSIESSMPELVDEPTPAATPGEAAITEEPSLAGMTLFNIVPGDSSATYEVGETFFNQDNRFAVAVGKTSQINGQIQVDQVNPQNSQIAPIEIDISQFQSDSSRRDGAVRDRFLESARFPIARFVPTQIEGLPDSYTPGQELTFKVTGDLTVKETSQPVIFDVTARIEGDTLIGTASTVILMSDFNVGPIELAGILGTEDEVKITFTFVARQ